MRTKDPKEILDAVLARAKKAGTKSVVTDQATQDKIEIICRTQHASVRLLMACLLGKLIDPKVDPRKPYTEIESNDCFSGRTLDEKFLTGFITANQLPCNRTTAFLTPVFRTMNRPLTKAIKLESRFRPVIDATLELLDGVAKNRLNPDLLLVETIRVLLTIRNENNAVRDSLLKNLKPTPDALPLSSNDISILLQQHLMCKHASRLPVLIVAAAYEAVGGAIGEHVKKLYSHTSADLQTGALGDVEIHLENDDAVVTVYEMKMKQVTTGDIDAAVEKFLHATTKVDHYVFVTTDKIEAGVIEYASEFYHKTGTEIAVRDCLGFLEHFLSFFHRHRQEFLNAYQDLLLSQSDADVSNALKNAFLTLRANAESLQQG